MKYLNFILFLCCYIYCNDNRKCFIPPVYQKYASVHNDGIYKSNRSVFKKFIIKNLYGASFYRMAQIKIIKENIIEPAVKYWEETLIPKKLINGTILLSRTCNGSTFMRKYKDRYVSVCENDCYTDYTCYNTIIPVEFMDKCYTKDNSSNFMYESNMSGSGLTGADLFIYFTYESSLCQNLTLAYSTPCQLNFEDDRPVFGIINFCHDKINYKFGIHEYMLFIRHQIGHILGINGVLYSFYRDESGQPLTTRNNSGRHLRSKNKFGLPTEMQNYGSVKMYKPDYNTMVKKEKLLKFPGKNISRETFYLVTPKLKEAVQKHFNCSSIKGAQLEDNGDTFDGISHFEKSIFQTELMTSELDDRSSVTLFSLALLEDTGWYKVNYSNAEHFLIRENIGCDFLNLSCYEYFQKKRKMNESIYPYCSDLWNKLSCSIKLQYVEYCPLYSFGKIILPKQFRYFSNYSLVSSDPYTDYCPIKKIFKRETDAGEIITNGDCKNAFNKYKDSNNYIWKETYGNLSFCINTNNPWTIYSEYITKKQLIGGAACFLTRCSKRYGVFIVIDFLELRCSFEGQIMNFTGVSPSTNVHEGSLVCPSCYSICDKTICDNLPNDIWCNNSNCVSNKSEVLNRTFQKYTMTLKFNYILLSSISFINTAMYNRIIFNK